MKNLKLSFLTFVLMLSFAACQPTETVDPVVDDVDDAVPPTEESAQPEADEDSKSTPVSYEQWVLPQSVVENNELYFKDAEVDCVKLENGYTEGGDLLSSLIVDTGARELMKLKVYTPGYVTKLENMIVKGAHEKFDSDLYAFSVCHLGDGVDVVAGALWPTGKPTIQNDGKFAGEAGRYFGDKEILAVVDNSAVTFFEDVRTKNQTATGAEVMPCSGKLSDDKENVLWTCFLGLHLTDDYVDGSDMTEWTLPLNGGATVKRDYVKYLSDK